MALSDNENLLNPQNALSDALNVPSNIYKRQHRSVYIIKRLYPEATPPPPHYILCIIYTV